MIPSSRSELRDSLTFKFDPGVSYGTLYNTNYVTQYAGFAFFITLSAALCTGLKKKYRVAALFSALLAFLMILKSDSGSGMIAFIGGLAFFILMLTVSLVLKRTGRSPEQRGGVYFAGVLILAVLFGGILFTGVFAGLKGSSSGKDRERIIRDVRTEKDGVLMDINGALLTLSYETGGDDFFLHLADEEGKEPEYALSDDGSRFCLKDPVYAGLEVFPVFVDERLCMAVDADGRELVFSDFKEEGGYLYLNNAGKFSGFKKYDRSGFFEDSLFTDRGFIWNCCLKLLPETLFKGVGAGTLVYAFPNDDDYFRLYDDNELDFYDVKAHSLYFQQFIENGMPAFFCFLFFCLLFFFKGVKGCICDGLNRNSLDSLIRPAILAGFLCYMICGLANDSNVNTAPVFWILVGSAAAFI